MTPLAVIVAILAVVTLLNLALSAAIIRLLREQRSPVSKLPLPKTGHTVAPFSVVGLDGTPITEDAVGEQIQDALVAFVSPTCPPCARLVEDWPNHAADLPTTTIAFVINTSTTQEAESYAAKFGSGVRTAVVDRGSEIAAAFDAHDATPTLIRVRGGRVTAAGYNLDKILADTTGITGKTLADAGR